MTGPEFLRIPPFPGAKLRQFKTLAGTVSPSALAECVDLLRTQRVGGTYWAAQPDLPERYLLIQGSEIPAGASALADEILCWDPEACERDPWHMLGRATGFVGDPASDAGIVAVLLDVPLYRSDPSGELRLRPSDPAELLGGRLPAAVANPFTGEPMSLADLIELSSHWRRLIDANRSIAAAVGFAFWKQDSVAPLLWNGTGDVRFVRDAPALGTVAIWRAKTPSAVADRLDRTGTPLVDVEDGFLRSQGLGADCIPPMSIVADRLGPYFDHRQPSELEQLLEHGEFGPPLLDRARQLREQIVAAGLGKYERGGARLDRLGGERRHVLVTGQVEDDRSVMTGGFGLSNLRLLEQVRAAEPDGFILYKPHPDVEAGHRKGAVRQADMARLADAVVADQPISSLLDMVDAVHVNTSLAGFEALLRGKAVTTHGVPFYAGWGLTCDRGPVPRRRTRRRSLDELVAATLLLYPRYLDPVTGLPCPAEIVVDRLCADVPDSNGLLVTARRIQGRLRRGIRKLVA